MSLTNHTVSQECASALAVRAAASCSGLMDDVSILLSRLALGLPFAYVHFSDGEVTASNWTACIPTTPGLCKWHFKGTPNGNQRYSDKLTIAVRSSMATSHPRLYAGIPCPAVHPALAHAARHLVPNRFGHRTSSVLFHDGNYAAMCHLLPELLRRAQTFGKGIHLVVNHGAESTRFISALRLSPLRSVVGVSSTHSFSAYGRLWNATKDYVAGDIVILCCGMLGRLLATAWIQQRPDTTFMELGSHFNPALFSSPSRFNKMPQVKLAYHRAVHTTGGAGQGCTCENGVCDKMADLTWLDNCLLGPRGRPPARTSCPPGSLVEPVI